MLATARGAGAEPAMARLQLAWLSVQAGKTGLLVTNLVVSYAIGGVAALGLFGVARFLVPTVVAPFAGLPTARVPAARVLIATNGLRTLAAVAILGTVVLEAPIGLFLVAVGLEAGVGALSRPLHVALLPFVARTPRGLVAANVTSSAVEGVGASVGPALVGVLLATGGPQLALAAVVLIYGSGVVALAGMTVHPVPDRRDAVRSIRAQALAGLRTYRDESGPRLVLSGIFLQTFVRGMLNVLIVVAALGVLGLGDPGVGSLNAILGVGGLIGAALALALTARTRMAGAFAASLAAWSAPLAFVGILPLPLVAGLAVLGIGVANALLDVSAYTLLQRTIRPDHRVAVFGLFDSLANGGQGLGGIVAPLLIAWVGIDAAMIMAGLTLPIAAIILWPGLRAADPGAMADDRRIELLRGLALFAPLSLAAIEDVASRLRPVTYAAGAWLIREGDEGHEFLIIDAGRIEVSQEGATIREMGPGGGVGEIALLYDVPRTASVRAVGEVRAFSLGRTDFLQAVASEATLGG